MYKQCKSMILFNINILALHYWRWHILHFMHIILHLVFHMFHNDFTLELSTKHFIQSILN